MNKPCGYQARNQMAVKCTHTHTTYTCTHTQTHTYISSEKFRRVSIYKNVISMNTTVSETKSIALATMAMPR